MLTSRQGLPRFVEDELHDFLRCGSLAAEAPTGYTLSMKANYTAVIKEDAGWWIGWVAEVPGVNCQEQTRGELVESLRVTLREALEMNRSEALGAAGEDFEELEIAV